MMRPVKTSFSRHKTFGIIFDIYYFQKISASRVFTAEAEDLTLNVKKVGIRIASLEERYVGGPDEKD